MSQVVSDDFFVLVRDRLLSSILNILSLSSHDIAKLYGHCRVETRMTLWVVIKDLRGAPCMHLLLRGSIDDLHIRT